MQKHVCPKTAQRISLFGHTDEEYSDAFHRYIDMQLRIHYDMKLYWLIDEQIHHGIRTFITGLRDGVDTMLAAYVLDCRRAMPRKGIRLHAVLAHPIREEAQPAQYRILRQADSYEYIREAASPDGLQYQTERMLDLSTHMLAVYFDASQNAACIYAVSRKINVLAYDPREILQSILVY